MLELSVFGSGVDYKMIRHLIALPIEHKDMVQWKWGRKNLQHIGTDTMAEIAYSLPVPIAN